MKSYSSFPPEYPKGLYHKNKVVLNIDISAGDLTARGLLNGLYRYAPFKKNVVTTSVFNGVVPEMVNNTGNYIVCVHYINSANSTGNFYIQVSIGTVSDGSVAGVASETITQAVACPALAETWSRIIFSFDATLTSEEQLMGISISRLGNDASDTENGEFWLTKLEFIYDFKNKGVTS